MAHNRKKAIGGFSSDIEYFVPKRKSPIITSSKATCESLKMFVEKGYDTPNKILGLIKKKEDWGYRSPFLVEQEERIVCQAYIDKGYGDMALNLR